MTSTSSVLGVHRIMILMLVLFLAATSISAKYRKEKTKRAYTVRSTANDLLVRHWNTSNDRLNSLDGNLMNHANETAAISLTKAPDGYVVFIKLNKVCNTYHPPKEWFTPDVINLMKENSIGPDEVFVQLEGPSLQTKIALTQNFCNEYYATFQVPLSGNYNLKVFRVRRHYEAAREQDKFAKMQYEEFLNVFVQIESHYPTPCEDPTQLLASGYWVSRWNRMTPTPINIRQKCAGSLDERRGMRLSTSVLTSFDYGKERCARDIDLYDWNRKICTQNYVEHLDIFGEEVNEHRPNVTDTRPKNHKLVGKKMLFVGDSHMRGLADVFLYHVCHFAVPHIDWNQTRVPMDQSTVNIQPDAAYLELTFLTKTASAYKSNCVFPPNDPRCQLFDPGCADMTFAYLGAMYCQNSIAEIAAGFDYVILNCGHLPAAQAHVTYTGYTGAVKGLFQKMKDSNVYNHAQVNVKDSFEFHSSFSSPLKCFLASVIL